MTLSEEVPSRHLAVATDLLALGLQLLLAPLPLEAQPLAVSLAGVDPLDTIRLNALTLDDTLLLDAIVADLMAVHLRLTLDTLRARLLTLHAGLSLDALRTRLMALGLSDGPLLPFGALRPLDTLLPLSKALRALRPFGALHLGSSTFGPLRTLLTLGLLAPALRLFDSVAVLAPGARTGRGCDRQGGDARGEKYPGHHKISFRTAKTVRPWHRSLR